MTRFKSADDKNGDGMFDITIFPVFSTKDQIYHAE